MKRIQVDVSECCGCRHCEMVCSFHHEGRFSPSLSRITVLKEDKYGFDYPVFCHQCDTCPPVKACPTGALSRTSLVTVRVNEEYCTGCGSCVDVCPLNAIKIYSSKPIVCDLCGGNPVCIDRCPTKALSYEDLKGGVVLPDDALKELLERWGIDG